ncbi:hypothetical protein FCU94_13920 [Vibrio sp. JPW-9-11-11]|uniref:hypothetical protein n=1 Tax=Vibrio sp. JPW-9-11-11 TaxID=1416532 RepID=UPI001594D56A|nr:hypothetical protein [Vibrio sp. JPW-9-11-11]NVD07985.1 hypothetical protein [Vibrio sp. JPW-9-11-11]
MKTVSGMLFLLSTSSLANNPVDDQRLLDALIKQGVICEDQTELEKQASLQIYLEKKFASPADKKQHPQTKESPDCISVKNNE